MRFGGIVSGAHDASAAIVDGEGRIEFASSSERFARVKHHSVLTSSLARRLESCEYKVYYEDLSALGDGGVDQACWESIAEKERRDLDLCGRYARKRDLARMVTHHIDHHRSHAAASFFTRPWASCDDTVILTMDGVGKDLMTANNIYVYDREANQFVSEHSDADSVGALYSAVASFLDFGDYEEGSMMGLAAFGEPRYFGVVEDLYRELYFGAVGNLHTRGGDWLVYRRTRAILEDRLGTGWRREDVAASAQAFLEAQVLRYAAMARALGPRLCYSGGVAQNVTANSRIAGLFDDVWIVSDPTDAGSALGAAAWAHAAETGRDRVRWEDAFLGHTIERVVNPTEVVDYLLEKKVCGLAHGPAEFGPRALGNRSLIGDVRFDIKDTVNAIKRREAFRPFGPAILEEEFDKWFEGPANGYMQFVCKPKHELRSVIHVDGTSRVQTVPSSSRSKLRPVLEEYFERTGIPMLLNTSLNIKGQPMVNDLEDADEFAARYRVRVF